MASISRQQKKVEGRVDISYHRYRIVGGLRNGTCQAIAYLGRRKIHETGESTVSDAVHSLKRMLDQHLDRLMKERVDGVPSEAEFREALLALDAVVPAEAMGLLIEHSRLPGGVGTMVELARRSGRDESAMVAEYIRLGRYLGTLLSFSPQQDELKASLLPIQTFSIVEVSSEGGIVTLQLRPEVLAALGATAQDVGTVRN